MREELVRKRSVFTDKHPDIKALKNQIATLEALEEVPGSTEQARVSFSAKVTPHAEIPGCNAIPAKDDAYAVPRKSPGQ